MQTQRKFAVVFAIAALASTVATGLVGCNTIHGIGKDTERAGEKIQKESDRHHRHHVADDGAGVRPTAP